MRRETNAVGKLLCPYYRTPFRRISHRLRPSVELYSIRSQLAASVPLSSIVCGGQSLLDELTELLFAVANEGPHELVFRDIALNESEPWSVVPVGANGSSSVSHPNLLSPPPSTLQHNSPTGVFKLVSVPPVPV